MKKLVLTLGAIACVVAVQQVASADIGITVNGQAAQFSPGPIERSGRVFVPLRAIFERLGATVVYTNGNIDATGSGGRSVHLQIGSTSANIAGQQQTLDIAPFVIGASTYVPLRFVAQALGATVNYDAQNSLVAIDQAGGGAPQQPLRPQQPQERPAPQNGSRVTLTDEEPAPNSSVASQRPTISASFSERVDPNNVRVALDGLDVTSQATRSQSGILFAPSSPLQNIDHRVEVQGIDQSGQSFNRTWRFATGNGGHAVAENFLRLSSPSNGSDVSPTFTIRGTTRPNAHVHVTAGAVANAIPGFSFGTGSYSGDTTADARGNFSFEVTLNAVRGGSVAVTVISTAADSHETAQQAVRLRIS
jgi:hypothetical protein